MVEKCRLTRIGVSNLVRDLIDFHLLRSLDLVNGALSVEVLTRVELAALDCRHNH